MSKHGDTLIPLGNIILNRCKHENWVYPRSVTLYGKGGTSVLIGLVTC